MRHGRYVNPDSICLGLVQEKGISLSSLCKIEIQGTNSVFICRAEYLIYP